ncbi:hypothetical protein DFH09DRAFT_1220094 [Mycena vulgaris]|nr:hypothetical protein DFH09DRAFT_1220094 [Mycena vulgaris]
MPHLSLAGALMRALKAASLAAAAPAQALLLSCRATDTSAHRVGAGWGLRRCTGKRRHREMAVSRGAELQWQRSKRACTRWVLGKGGIMVWAIGCRWMWDTRRRVRVPWCHERVRQVLRDPQQRVAVRKGRSEREREAAVTSPSAVFGSCPRSSWTSVAACCRYFVGRFFE